MDIDPIAFVILWARW